jgi:hypothetical protein
MRSATAARRGWRGAAIAVKFQDAMRIATHLQRAAAVGLLMTFTAPCLAQPAPNSPTVDPQACSEEQRLRLDERRRLRDPSNQSLSEKLEQTEGVLCPPNVDPEIKIPAPGGGRTPVIPPPGSPGGDPTVQPK